MSGGQVGTAGNRTGDIGIWGLSTGTSGDIDITANPVFATLDAIRATFSNPGSGSARIGINAGATISSSGGIGVNLQNGLSNTVTNLGAITGTTGIATTGGTTAIINAGSITGTGGTALQLSGANNLFVMDGPGAALSGSAIGSGSDTFRLAGDGTNSFDASQIGAGWTLLDKAGASTWTLTGNATYAGPTTVSAGTLSVNGSLAGSAVTVNSSPMWRASGTRS